MAGLSVVPKFMQEGPFKKIVEMSEVKNMTKKQRAAYQESLRQLWDENGKKEDAFDKGRKKGRKEAEEEAAQKVKAAEDKAEKAAKAEMAAKAAAEKAVKAVKAVKLKAEKDAKAVEEKAKREKLEAIKKILQTGMSSLDCAKIFNVDQAYVMDIQKSIKRKG